MNSFFQKDSTGKRYAISRRDGEPFGVAGIWENWCNPLTSTWERTFAVITVPANALIAPIHDRMLAVLPNEQFLRWLSDEADPRDLLVPFPAEHLVVAAPRQRRFWQEVPTVRANPRRSISPKIRWPVRPFKPFDERGRCVGFAGRRDRGLSARYHSTTYRSCRPSPRPRPRLFMIVRLEARAGTLQRH
jgi:hypothetical protein